MNKDFIQAFFEDEDEALGLIDLLFVENEELFRNFKLIDGLRGMTFEVDETLCYKDDNLVNVKFVFKFDNDNDKKVILKASHESLSLKSKGSKDEHGDYVFDLS